MYPKKAREPNLQSCKINKAATRTYLKLDVDLKADLLKYVTQNLKRKEVLDFISKNYLEYAWSFRRLCRRLNFFQIKYADEEIDLGQARAALRAEMDGPGRLLGYRSLHKKIREIHCLRVSRRLVYASMQDINPAALTARGNVGKPKKGPKLDAPFSAEVSC